MEKKIRAAIVGYGNIGRYALEAIEAAADFECAGVVRRAGAENLPSELAAYPVVKDIAELKDVDVAILATPTRKVEEYAKKCLALGINTVDSFDIHTKIVDLRRSLDAEAKKHGAVSVVSAGWDPGSDSVVRTLMQSLAPEGVSYTNFGPGARHRRGARCPLDDHSLGHQHPSPYGVRRTGRRGRLQSGGGCHQGRCLLCERRNPRAASALRGRTQ